MLVFLLHADSCTAKTYSREIMLFFLYFFCLVASISPPTPFVPQERLLKLFIYREEEVEGQDILFFFCQIWKDYSHHDPISQRENVTT